MRLTWIAGFTLMAAVALAAACGGDGDGSGVIVEGGGPLALRLERIDDAFYIRWDVQQGAAAYKISGSGTYWPLCVEARPNIIDDVTFNRILGKDVAEYVVPEAQGENGFYLKGLTAEVFALNSEQLEALQEGPDVSTVAEGSLAFVAEGAECN